ncbi:MAG: hypothetical protein L0027_07050, partial [Candidatus Rokubacteria bacterium]|nr:hypothetical protein [Candidatus Rokubacteria bacterium]
ARPSGGLPAALLAGSSAAFLLVLLDGALEPRSGEPLLLRFARAAADHPVRTAVAGTCLALALRRGTAVRGPRGPEQD